MIAARLTWVAAFFLVCAACLGPVLGDSSAFRYPQTGLAVILAVCWWRWPDALAAPLTLGSLRAILLASWLWCLACGATHFWAFEIGGMDFSIFEWMLGSTVHGHFGYSRIFDVNHFGVHSTFLMLGLVPFYALFNSPWVLLIAGATLIWAGLFPLLRLVRWAHGGQHGGLELMVMLAWLGNPWLGTLLNAGFRIEAFVPVLTAWFLVGWVNKRPWLWAMALAGLWFSKEDTCLFLASFAVGAWLVERSRWRAALLVAVTSMGWLVAYVAWLQPALLGHPPLYTQFWSQFGRTLPEVVLGALSHPTLVLWRIATSRWWAMALPALLVPLGSARAFFGMASTVAMLGAATYEPMHQFEMYYPVPLVSFTVFGALDVWRARPSRAARSWVIAALLLFPLFWRGYARAVPVNWARVEAMEQVRAAIANDAHVCAQLVLLPHLGVDSRLEPLGEPSGCGDRPEVTLVVNPELDTDPIENDDFARWLLSLEQRTTTQFPTGFQVIRARVSQ